MAVQCAAAAVQHTPALNKQIYPEDLADARAVILSWLISNLCCGQPVDSQRELRWQDVCRTNEQSKTRASVFVFYFLSADCVCFLYSTVLALADNFVCFAQLAKTWLYISSVYFLQACGMASVLLCCSVQQLSTALTRTQTFAQPHSYRLLHVAVAGKLIRHHFSCSFWVWS